MMWGVQVSAMKWRFETVDQWRTWLAKNHEVAREAWLVIRKKHARGSGLTYIEALEEALCFGWIDGILKRLDDEKHLVRFSPRRRNSIWSELNKKRIGKLMREGRMTEAGLAKIKEAKANGQWDKAAQREDITLVPAELTAALARNEQARRNFDKLAPSCRKRFIYWISMAKRQETRDKRVAESVGLLTRDEPLGLK
jgi:uncharacterized protein YdeI (YjbR/CyaY-like superfamily)